MAGDLGAARHVMRCRLLSGDDVLMMAPCQCVLSSRHQVGAAARVEDAGTEDWNRGSSGDVSKQRPA